MKQPSQNTPLNQLIERRYSRRSVLKGSLALGATVALPGLLSGCGSDLDFEFAGLQHGVGHDHLVDQSHSAAPLIRWGDPVVAGAPEFDVHHQSAAAQEQQFGYNNDYIGLIPVERNRLLMCANHEYAIDHLMFPEVAVNLRGRTDWSKVTAEMVQIQLAAIGVSVVELIRNDGVWHCNRNSGLNRRITARSTTIQISGPAAGNSRLQTDQDPTGRSISAVTLLQSVLPRRLTATSGNIRWAIAYS